MTLLVGLLIGALRSPLVSVVDDKLPSDNAIRAILQLDDFFDQEERKLLIRLGERALSAYHRILEAPDATSEDRVAVFAFLLQINVDRKSFLEPAIAGLEHPKGRVREAAVRLLAKIGASQDTQPIVALLFDKEWTVAVSAAEVLSELGDRRTLAAMNVWLNSSSGRNSEHEKLQAVLRKQVIKNRDELKTRLEKEKASGGEKWSQPQIQQPGDVLPTDREVRDLINRDELYESKMKLKELVRHGEKLFPIYHRILNAKDVTRWDLCGVFDTLKHIKGDRSSFIEPALAALAHPHVSPRRAAMELLTKIGSVKDTVPIVALLSDKEYTIAIAAAKALSEMGDRRSLAAMNVWLNSSSDRKPDEEKLQAEVRKYVIQYRDDLKARLAKEEAPKK